MAEAISLVSGILTLVDFGCKVISGTSSVLESRHGTAPDIHELDLILKAIQESHRPYREHVESLARKRLLPEHRNMLAMLQECEELHRELSKVISTLQVSDKAFSRTLASWRIVIRKMRKSEYIGNLRVRLLELDRYVSKRIEEEMQDERYASIMAELRAVEKQKASLGIVTSSTLELVQAEILQIVSKKIHVREIAKERSLWSILSRDGRRYELEEDKENRVPKITAEIRPVPKAVTDEEAAEEEVQLATQVQQLTNALIKLKMLQREQDASLRQNQVIRSLYFTEVFRRFEKIHSADASSNEWVFDPLRTNFQTWLESQDQDDGLFYIFGKAGSGKSTLMKFLFEDDRTYQSLNKWAGDSEPHTAAYYFWNQGSELQKSGTGLFQSLLYQILRQTPDLITPDWDNRPHHEVWTADELQAAFEKIANSTKLQSRFCFFIDGLDEYEGDQEDVTKMLNILAAFKHIKICASSRPHRHYEKFLKRDTRTFDIADFTQSDVENHARNELGKSKKFGLLTRSQPECAKIITDISAWASGVWLWVSLVTSEIRKEAEKGEDLDTLRRIVDEFPSDLDKFFKRMLEKIHPRHKEQMAQIFLITVEELQPLPLFSFALLEKERAKPYFERYAIDAKVEAFQENELRAQYPDLRSRIHNRCGDLLVVDDMRHPVFLSHSVDFLHRTVRDFLRDNYRRELDKLVKDTFNPLVSLCNICLALLKGAEIKDFRTPSSLKVIIGLTDELLYYAHEAERRFGESVLPSLIPIMDQLNATNTTFARRGGGKRHWTHAKDLPGPLGLDAYKEGGNCNFLALAVQTRLTGYVRTKLEENPQLCKKDGRPLLDYALRPLRITPIAMPCHSVRDEASIDVEMVKLQLGPPCHADLNQPVYLYSEETVWGLFLISIAEKGRFKVSTSLQKSWYEACKAMIRAGAQLNYSFVQCDLTVLSVLEYVFTASEVTVLLNEFAETERARVLEAQQSDGRCLVQ